MDSSLNFRLNACPICLICLLCEKTFGKDCLCQPKEVVWKKKLVERDYKVEFRHQPLSKIGAAKQKIKLDLDFVTWFQSNIFPQLQIPPSQPDANICKVCINKYVKKGI